MDKMASILPRAFLPFYRIKRSWVNTSTSVVVVVGVVVGVVGAVVGAVVVMPQIKARTASKAVSSIRFNSVV
jgi:hypothetical protein